MRARYYVYSDLSGEFDPDRLRCPLSVFGSLWVPCGYGEPLFHALQKGRYNNGKFFTGKVHFRKLRGKGRRSPRAQTARNWLRHYESEAWKHVYVKLTVIIRAHPIYELRRFGYDKDFPNLKPQVVEHNRWLRLNLEGAKAYFFRDHGDIPIDLFLDRRPSTLSVVPHHPKYEFVKYMRKRLPEDGLYLNEIHGLQLLTNREYGVNRDEECLQFIDILVGAFAHWVRRGRFPELAGKEPVLSELSDWARDLLLDARANSSLRSRLSISLFPFIDRSSGCKGWVDLLTDRLPDWMLVPLGQCI